MLRLVDLDERPRRLVQEVAAQCVDATTPERGEIPADAHIDQLQVAGCLHDPLSIGL